MYFPFGNLFFFLSLTFLSCTLLNTVNAGQSVSSPSQPVTHNWGGADTYFLFALSEADRLEHLSVMKSANMKVVRIFLSAVGAGSKGTSAVDVPDVEPTTVGIFNDTILEKVDQLMYEAVQYGVKLDISMHDRYALGCWSEDAYYYKYRFPSGYPGCDAQKNDVHEFYQNSTIENEFDNRLIHILTHRNPYFNNRTWGEISEAIFTFAPENEAQSYIKSQDWQWGCRRAKVMKPYLKNSTILLSTNGATVEDSLQTPLFECPELDIMAIHNYNGGEAYAANYSKVARALADKYQKRVYVEEFGALGDNNGSKADSMQQQIDGMLTSHIPFMFWELLKTKPISTSYETWIDCKAWDIISNRSKEAYGDTEGAFQWPELFGTVKQDKESE